MWWITSELKVKEWYDESLGREDETEGNIFDQYILKLSSLFPITL